MSELHLDLCRQSTEHLKETIEIIKENLRILEVFINAGYTDDEKGSTITNVVASTSGETALALERLNGQGESSKESAGKSRASRGRKKELHECCCCMCPTRLEWNRKICSNNYHGISPLSANLTFRRTPFPSYKRPVSMPRLNRTASLRRDTAIERSQRENKSTLPR